MGVGPLPSYYQSVANLVSFGVFQIDAFMFSGKYFSIGLGNVCSAKGTVF